MIVQQPFFKLGQYLGEHLIPQQHHLNLLNEFAPYCFSTLNVYCPNNKFSTVGVKITVGAAIEALHVNKIPEERTICVTYSKILNSAIPSPIQL